MLSGSIDSSIIYMWMDKYLCGEKVSHQLLHLVYWQLENGFYRVQMYPIETVQMYKCNCTNVVHSPFYILKIGMRSYFISSIYATLASSGPLSSSSLCYFSTIKNKKAWGQVFHQLLALWTKWKTGHHLLNSLLSLISFAMLYVKRQWLFNSPR